MKETELIIEEFKSLRAVIEDLKTKIDIQGSPKLSRKQAKKFLKYGEAKFRFLLHDNRIRAHRDDFNEEYFLRYELQMYLESN